MVQFSTPNLLLLLFLFSFRFGSALTTDGLSLLAFKSAISVDRNHTLSTWVESDRTPCHWVGVTCHHARVIHLSLPNCSLQGYLPSELGLLSSLLTLRLPHNNLSGPVPTQIRTLVSLTFIDLSHNSLSGPIPADLGSLKNLTHLDLSDNRFNGSLPPSIPALPRLAGVLNLSFNAFSGSIPAALGNLPVDVSLDLRNNNFSGEIPQSGTLLNQGPTAFTGNPGLCGFPLKKQCHFSEQGPGVPLADQHPVPDLSFPGPQQADMVATKSPPSHQRSLTVPLLSGVLALALVTIFILQWQFRKMRRSTKCTTTKKGKKEEDEKREGQSGGEIFVAVDEGFGLELEELLRASAYVVGKSRSGIVYKVVVGRGGGAVAVRRLSEADDGNATESAWRRRRDFESEAMAIGRAKHPNVVSLRAYYYAPDEKLLVYDYIPNGSLHAALHGRPNTPSAPLMWAVRLKVVQGTARGLAFLHECSPRKYIHGGIKSSKILLDEDHHPYISGFGLARLISGHKSSSKLHSSHGVGPKMPNSLSPTALGYLAPEARTLGNVVTQKSDVYSFGIVLLEILTGRLPVPEQEGEADLECFVRRAFKEERPLSEVVDPALHHEVYAKKQVLAVFHVALGCTETDPESRPRMRAVSESLDRIGGPPQ